MKIYNILLLLVLSVTMLFGGYNCGNAGKSSDELVNKDNYEKIEIDMDISEVKTFLGEPTQALSLAGTDTIHYMWMTKDNKHLIDVRVENDKVKSKEWKDSKKK